MKQFELMKQQWEGKKQEQQLTKAEQQKGTGRENEAVRTDETTVGGQEVGAAIDEGRATKAEGRDGQTRYGVGEQGNSRFVTQNQNGEEVLLRAESKLAQFRGEHAAGLRGQCDPHREGARQQERHK